MRIALLSPYHGGSHRGWAEGWSAHSRHEIEILGLSARFWKWRMHGAAVTLARRFRASAPVDALVATDMLDLAAFLALTRRATASLPTVLYLHENQITYPLPADPTTGPMRRQAGERDRHYGFVNFTSMLAADRVAFNSVFHRDELLGALPPFLRHYPDHRETGRVAEIAARATVLPVGLHLADVPEARPADPDATPLVLWNQRWEYDKNPAGLMRVLCALADEGVPFEVALCGRRYGRRPPALERGVARLGERVIHQGHLPREQYVELLGRAGVVVSTAHHEFFGVAVAEAIAAGAYPLLPNRLAYPELIPEKLHAACLYRGESDLRRRLRQRLVEPASRGDVVRELAATIRERYDWRALAQRYDDLLEAMAAGDPS